MTNACLICGDVIESKVPSSWHPSKLKRRAERDMQNHVRTHSFVEVLRFEIRQDLDQVPDEQRPSIVRDIYRELLGKHAGKGFSLNDPDGRGLYSIDEALGGLEVYRLWRSANQCGLRACEQHK